MSVVLFRRPARRRGPEMPDGQLTLQEPPVLAETVLVLGQAVVIRHRAAGGADLAALAAADHWTEGSA
ncbi:hypothetical protein ACWDRX_39515, partial [Streptomyces nigra]